MLSATRKNRLARDSNQDSTIGHLLSRKASVVRMALDAGDGVFTYSYQDSNLRIGYVSSGNEIVLVVLLKRAYSGGCLSVEYSVAGVDANVNNNKKLIWNGAANLLADGTTHYYLGGRENGNGAPTVIPLTTFDRTVSTDVTAFACLGDGLVMYDIALKVIPGRKSIWSIKRYE